jgi:hypothetical protein
MQRIAATVLVFSSCAGLSAAAYAQLTATPASALSLAPSIARSREADQVRGWYRDYLGREVGPELSAWVELLRGGMPATDVQATILGSDEFTSRGRDRKPSFAKPVTVTWAEPSSSELRRWTNRLAQLRDDRFALAREILLAGSQSPLPGDHPRPLRVRRGHAPGSRRSVEIGGTVQLCRPRRKREVARRGRSNTTLNSYVSSARMMPS